jgi:signal transduction histidine kinase
MKQSQQRARKLYWLFAILAVITIAIVSTAYAAMQTARDTQASLMQRTNTIAALIPASSLTELNGHEGDIGSPAYEALKQDLKDVRSSNQDIRFVYIMALKQEQAYFVIDAEEQDSADYSPPGQLYEEDAGEVAAVFQSKQGIVLPVTSDRWGSWLSAYSPILNESGQVVGVLGLDVPANDYYRAIVMNALIPFLLSAVILVLLLWTKRRSEYQENYVSEKAFFLSFAGHEIRSPLTSVKWALQPLLTTLPEHSTEQKTVEKIDESLSHILDTVDDVLSLQATESSRDKKLEKENVHISEVIDTTIDSLRLFSEEHQTKITNVTTTEDQEMIVSVDAMLFKRVVSNFLVNSVKYSPDHTTVEVKVFRTRKGWAASIHNEGDGLTPDEQAKIMKGFYRTKAAEKSGQKGTGLGVRLSSDIINRHGGHLEIDSKPNQGVTFIIHMPN